MPREAPYAGYAWRIDCVAYPGQLWLSVIVDEFSGVTWARFVPDGQGDRLAGVLLEAVRGDFGPEARWPAAGIPEWVITDSSTDALSQTFVGTVVRLGVKLCRHPASLAQAVSAGRMARAMESVGGGFTQATRTREFATLEERNSALAEFLTWRNNRLPPGAEASPFELWIQTARVRDYAPAPTTAELDLAAFKRVAFAQADGHPGEAA